MKHLTMQELEDLGFEIVKSYKHGEYVTQICKKGFIKIETTFDLSNNGAFVGQDLTIEEVFVSSFSSNQLKQLDKILNKKL